MSSCKDCRRPVLWLKRVDEPARWHPPLDLESGRTAFCVEEGLGGDQQYARVTIAYNTHVCSAEDLQTNGVGPVSTTKFSVDAASVSAAAVAWAQGTRTGANSPAIEENVIEPSPEEESVAPSEEIEETFLVDGRQMTAEERREYRNAQAYERELKNKVIYRKMQDKANVVKCPKCNARKGMDCWNLSERANGRQVSARTPHSERIHSANDYRDSSLK